MINNKKGISSLGVIVGIIIIMIVAVVLIFVFKKYFGQEVDVVSEQLDSLKDEDGDNVRNFLDKCPYIPAGNNPSDKYGGCPAGREPTKEKS